MLRKIKAQIGDRTSVSNSIMEIPFYQGVKINLLKVGKTIPYISFAAVEARSRYLRRYKILSPVDKNFFGVDTSWGFRQ